MFGYIIWEHVGYNKKTVTQCIDFLQAIENLTQEHLKLITYTIKDHYITQNSTLLSYNLATSKSSPCGPERTLYSSLSSLCATVNEDLPIVKQLVWIWGSGDGSTTKLLPLSTYELTTGGNSFSSTWLWRWSSGSPQAVYIWIRKSLNEFKNHFFHIYIGHMGFKKQNNN
jgi:hypothetical protein